jgi:hypothetical protein
MSDDDLKRLSVVRKKELDDVQSEIADIENGTTSADVMF